MSPEALRFVGLLAGAVFTLLVYLIVRPQKRILLVSLAPAADFALSDLLMEFLAYRYGIWECHGEPMLFHVPIVMLANFFVNGIGYCLIVYVILRHRRGLRLAVDIVLFVTVFGLILYLLEFVWRDSGVTTYLKPYTHWYVLAAWQVLLWVPVGGFLLMVKVFIGFENIEARRPEAGRSDNV